MNTWFSKKSTPVFVLAASGIALITSSIYTVDGGHRAIKFNRFKGLLPNHYREGWHLRIPYFEWPIIFDIRTHYEVVNAVTGNKDLQTVMLTVRVLYRPMEDKLPALYRYVGKDYDKRVLPSIINEILRIKVVSYLCNIGTIYSNPTNE